MFRNQYLQWMWELSEGEHVFLPYMNEHGGWIESPPLTVLEAIEILKGRDFEPTVSGINYYFTPLRYSKLRRKGTLGKPGVIFADIDNDTLSGITLEPSLLVKSSSRHWHGYWFLEEPAEPELWAPRAKGWTKLIGADPGGWDATQVLRVPDTYNFKYTPPERVRVVSFNADRKYALEQFPEATVTEGRADVSAPVPDQAFAIELLQDLIEDDDIPLGSVYWLSATAQDIKVLGNIDRSRVLWQQERVLLEYGLSLEQVFQLLYYTGINKWFGQPERLWKEINKAAGG